MIKVDISYGELFDKISILEIKKSKLITVKRFKSEVRTKFALTRIK